MLTNWLDWQDLKSYEGWALVFVHIEQNVPCLWEFAQTLSDELFNENVHVDR